MKANLPLLNNIPSVVYVAVVKGAVLDSANRCGFKQVGAAELANLKPSVVIDTKEFLNVYIRDPQVKKNLHSLSEFILRKCHNEGVSVRLKAESSHREEFGNRRKASVVSATLFVSANDEVIRRL